MFLILKKNFFLTFLKNAFNTRLVLETARSRVLVPHITVYLEDHIEHIRNRTHLLQTRVYTHAYESFLLFPSH